MNNIFSRDIGIDLGTANTLVYAKGKGIIISEPSVVAYDTRTNEIKKVGLEAKKVIGRTPSSIVAIRPLRAGVISDFEITTIMLQDFIKRSTQKNLFKPRVVICIPSGVTAVEKRAVREVAMQAGAKKVYIVKEPMASALGANLAVSSPVGSMIVDVGGGTSEVAVISLGGIVTCKSIRIAGDEFDRDILNYIKKKYNLLIGECTAEKIKMTIGSAYPFDNEISMNIRGRNLISGLPENIKISSEEVRNAICSSLSSIIEAIKLTLEQTPPELSADIIDNGVTLMGGGAMLKGLDSLIAQETGLKVIIAKRPLECVALGTGVIIDNLNSLQDLLLENEYR